MPAGTGLLTCAGFFTLPLDAGSARSKGAARLAAGPQTGDPERAGRAGQKAARSQVSVRVPCPHHDAGWVFGRFQYPTPPLRARKNLDRHPNYILAAYMAFGT